MSVRMLKFKVTPYGTFESGQVVAGLPSHLEYQMMESGDAVPAEFADFSAEIARAAGAALLGADRKRLLIFGNSIASQSTSSLAQQTTYTTAAANAGASVLSLASVAGIVDGSKIAIGLYEGSVFSTTVSGAPAGNNVTLAQPLPKLVRASASISAYTTARAFPIRQGIGPVSAAVMLLGMPVEILRGYGYGGAKLSEMLFDLAEVLQRTRPNFVALHLFENDIAADATLAQLTAWTRFAVSLVRGFGAVPIICTSVPSTSFNSSGRAAVFDGLLQFVRGELGEVFIDFSTPWLDATAVNSRPPLAGWATDGIHPNASRRVSAAVYALDTLRGLIGDGASYMGRDLSANTGLAGSGGTATGLQAGSVVAAGYTIIADAGITATASKTADDKQRIVASVPGASNISSTQLTASKTFTLPANAGGAGVVRCVCKARINALTNVSMLYLQATCSGGEVYGMEQSADFGADPALIGRTITFETPAFVVPEGATTIAPQFKARPYTLASPSGVAVDVVIEEMAIIPAAVL